MVGQASSWVVQASSLVGLASFEASSSEVDQASSSEGDQASSWGVGLASSWGVDLASS